MLAGGERSLGSLEQPSFSDAANRRRFFGGVLSTDAPLTARSRCLRSLSEGGVEGSRIGEGLGTYEEPFSAYQYRYIQRELSHVTLARGGSGAVADEHDRHHGLAPTLSMLRSKTEAPRLPQPRPRG